MPHSFRQSVFLILLKRHQMEKVVTAAQDVPRCSLAPRFHSYPHCRAHSIFFPVRTGHKDFTICNGKRESYFVICNSFPWPKWGGGRNVVQRCTGHRCLKVSQINQGYYSAVRLQGGRNTKFSSHTVCFTFLLAHTVYVGMTKSPMKFETDFNSGSRTRKKIGKDSHKWINGAVTTVVCLLRHLHSWSWYRRVCSFVFIWAS